MLRSVRRFGFFGAVALALLAAPAGAQQRPALLGQVVNEQGDPVAGARVEARADGRSVGRALTGRSGRYVLAGLPAGSYTVRVAGLGYREAERTVRIGAGGEAQSLDVTLEAAPIRLEGVSVVSVTRSSTPVAAVPGAVTVVGGEEVQAELAVSKSVGEVLAKEVPGLAVGTQSMSNYGQSLRGRNVSVLIDGIPQSTLRNVSRDFVNIDPSMIQRVEVLRGATALYGDGATGGVINIITKAPGAGATRYRSSASVGGSLSSVGDGFTARLSQSATGSRGPVDFTLGGSLARTTGFYDAEGDLIPADPHGQGGLADTDSWDVLGKLGYSWGEQRLQLSANHFRSLQDTEFTADPSVDEFAPGEQKARALPGLREAEPQGTRNSLVSLDYSNADLLGSRVRGQLYFRDYLTRFRGFDRRRFRTVTDTLADGSTQQRRVLLSGQVSQSFIDSHKLGGRLEAESWPLGAAGPSLVWGADYTYENTSQPVGIMDPDAYDASNGLVFEKIGERVWVPPLRPHNLGVFAQLGWQVTEGVLVRGGVRHERIRMRVDDFVTLDDNRVYGGELAYDPTLFNVGAVVGNGRPLSAFVNFSQGFSLADIGRILRAARDGFDLGANDLPAPKVDHYEVGARGMWDGVEASLSAFRSSSELGTNLVLNAETGMLEVARAPERIHGVEATLDARPWERLRVGGTASWAEGDYHHAGSGEWYALNGYRIQPPKLTAHAELETLPGWHNRLQVLHSGERDRIAADRPDPTRPLGYGEFPVRSFTVVDLTSTLRLGAGTVQLGIENLLNQQYFDIVSQLDLVDGNAYYTAARGRAFTLGYTVNY